MWYYTPLVAYWPFYSPSNTLNIRFSHYTPPFLPYRTSLASVGKYKNIWPRGRFETYYSLIHSLVAYIWAWNSHLSQTFTNKDAIYKKPPKFTFFLHQNFTKLNCKNFQTHVNETTPLTSNRRISVNFYFFFTQLVPPKSYDSEEYCIFKKFFVTVTRAQR